MANGHASVDEQWLRGPQVEVDGHLFHLLAPEGMIWNKLYVLQHDRCDWPDILTVLYSIGTDLDWRRLVNRTVVAASLLAAVLSVFALLCPAPARFLPVWAWSYLCQHLTQSEH